MNLHRGFHRIVLAVMLAIAGLLASPTLSFAGVDEAVRDYDVSVTVLRNGDLEITERVEYFFDEERHGIYRSLPLLDNLPNDMQQLYVISNMRIEADGIPANVEYAEDENYGVWRIGNPEILISGLHEYTLSYTISGAFTRNGSGNHFLSWDLVGQAWEVPINTAHITVKLPEKPLNIECFYGLVGSSTVCPVENRETTYSTTVSDLNRAGASAVTFDIELSQSALVGVPDPTIRKRPATWTEQVNANKNIGLFSGGIAFAAMMLLVVTRRRTAKTAAVISAVRFDPPELTPGEVAVALHGSFSSRALTATLLDLSVRRVIQISMDGKHMEISQWDRQAVVADWERDLLSTLFGRSDVVSLKEYRPEVTTTIAAMKETLLVAAHDSGRRSQSSLKYRVPVMITAFVGVLLAIVGGVLGSQRPIVFLVCIPAAVVMLLLSVIGFFVIPQFETPSSAEFLSHMKGLIRAMDTDAAALRREFAQRSGLSPAAVFATMLPLAVVFELENSWTGAFPDVSDDDLRAVGWGFVPMGSISDSIDSAVDILSTVSEAPSSSDGGGSSGGGGGGGGGGSW